MNDLNKILDDDEKVKLLLKQNNLPKALPLFFSNQKVSWQLLKEGCKSLESVKLKKIDFDNFTIILQYNPRRIYSALAKIDNDSIKERKCFLCIENLPSGQKAILNHEKYLILCNPFPIFKQHFTIPHINHTAQKIKNNFSDMLCLAKDFSHSYNVFYNGPKCGASAPDHLHFQAGERFFLPIENEFSSLKKMLGQKLIQNKNIEINSIDDTLRRFFTIEGKDENLIIKFFDLIYNSFKKVAKKKEEPPLNIISSYEEKKGYRIIIFLRRKHRPSHFYKEGNKRVILSPGVIDLGGVCILPIKKDFEQMTRQTLQDIFNEVTISQKNFTELNRLLQNEISKIF